MHRHRWNLHAWSCFFAPWNAEATVFVLTQTRFNPRALLKALVRYHVTTLCAPPTVCRVLVREDLPSWRVDLCEVASAGEPLNAIVIEGVRSAWGLTIRDGYGQTETVYPRRFTALPANAWTSSRRAGSLTVAVVSTDDRMIMLKPAILRPRRKAVIKVGFKTQRLVDRKSSGRTIAWPPNHRGWLEVVAARD
jgi:acyl-coenzyme A synthetase/AMP-(fatty) acid ligase